MSATSSTMKAFREEELQHAPWFFDDLTQEEAEKALKLFPKKGNFLIRRENNALFAAYVTVSESVDDNVAFGHRKIEFVLKPRGQLSGYTFDRGLTTFANVEGLVSMYRKLLKQWIPKEKVMVVTTVGTKKYVAPLPKNHGAILNNFIESRKSGATIKRASKEAEKKVATLTQLQQQVVEAEAQAEVLATTRLRMTKTLPVGTHNRDLSSQQAAAEVASTQKSPSPTSPPSLHKRGALTMRQRPKPYLWNVTEVFFFGCADKAAFGDGRPLMHFQPLPAILSLQGRKIRRIFLGDTAGAALAADGTFYTWGSIGSLSPEPMGFFHSSSRHIVEVSCGYAHIAVCCDNGEVWTWGLNDRGQCGVGSTVQIDHPTLIPVTRRHPMQSVACGFFATAAVGRVDGDLWLCGNYLATSSSDVRALIRVPFFGRKQGQLRTRGTLFAVGYCMWRL